MQDMVCKSRKKLNYVSKQLTQTRSSELSARAQKTYSNSASIKFLAAVTALYVGLRMSLSGSLGIIVHPPRYFSFFPPIPKVKTEHDQGNSFVVVASPSLKFLVPQCFSFSLPILFLDTEVGNFSSQPGKAKYLNSSFGVSIDAVQNFRQF